MSGSILLSTLAGRGETLAVNIVESRKQRRGDMIHYKATFVMYHDQEGVWQSIGP